MIFLGKNGLIGLAIIGLILSLIWTSSIAQEKEDEEESSPESVPMEKIVSYELQAPAFIVKPRKEEALELFPCMDCHEDEKPDPRERELVEEHDNIVLEHGGERFWCTTCHHLEQRNFLRSLKNKLIDFDQAYRLCGQCHFQRQKDWFFGGHGKRIGNWKGERQLNLCPECHNPHSPSIKPQTPDAPPLVRTGLPFIPSQRHARVQVWEKYLPNKKKEETDGN